MMNDNRKSSFKGLVTTLDKKKQHTVLYTAIALLVMLVFVFLAEAGDILSPYIVRVLNLCAIYAIIALSMNLVNGFTGQFSLGSAGFMAVGAYVTTLLFLPPATKEMVFYLQPIVPWLANVELPFVVALLIGGLVTAFIAFLIGLPVLRLRGDYLAIATLGFSEIIRIVFTNTQSLTNGATGIKAIPSTVNLWWTFGVLALVIIFLVRLMKTSYGRAFKAIRDDEIAAEAMGISLFKHKMLSFVVSGFIAGIGGGLMASVVSAITPMLFRYIITYDILLIVVLGGMGSITGSVLAGFIFIIAKEVLRFLDNGMDLGFVKLPAVAGLRMVVFSVLLMIVVIFYRQGLMGGKEFSWDGVIAFFKSLPGKFKKTKKNKKNGGGTDNE